MRRKQQVPTDASPYTPALILIMVIITFLDLINSKIHGRWEKTLVIYEELT